MTSRTSYKSVQKKFSGDVNFGSLLQQFYNSFLPFVLLGDWIQDGG